MLAHPRNDLLANLLSDLEVELTKEGWGIDVSGKLKLKFKKNLKVGDSNKKWSIDGLGLRDNLKL